MPNNNPPVTSAFEQSAIFLVKYMSLTSADKQVIGHSWVEFLLIPILTKDKEFFIYHLD